MILCPRFDFFKATASACILQVSTLKSSFPKSPKIRSPESTQSVFEMPPKETTQGTAAVRAGLERIGTPTDTSDDEGEGDEIGSDDEDESDDEDDADEYGELRDFVDYDDVDEDLPGEHEELDAQLAVEAAAARAAARAERDAAIEDENDKRPRPGRGIETLPRTEGVASKRNGFNIVRLIDFKMKNGDIAPSPIEINPPWLGYIGDFLLELGATNQVDWV